MTSKDNAFDLETFLSSVAGGRSMSKYRKDEIVFAQGDPADAVFTSGRVNARSPWFLSRARKPWSQSMGRGTFLAKAA
jgi:CRP/FNR family transcriptional regulator, cyclic AMP receptor protein